MLLTNITDNYQNHKFLTVDKNDLEALRILTKYALAFSCQCGYDSSMSEETTDGIHNAAIFMYEFKKQINRKRLLTE